MNDWNTEVIGQYELEVENLRKGRGAWIFETNRGLKLLKEYKGSVKRLEFEEKVLDTVRDFDSLRVDQYMRNREGELVSTAEDGSRYVVKDWYTDRECDLKDMQEILSAVRQIAILHRQLREVEENEEWNLKSMISPALNEAMGRHNRELKKARTFIRDKRRKNEFELCIIRNFDWFYEQAVEAERGMETLFAGEGGHIRERYFVCHGELNQHHILMGKTYIAFTEFNKMHLGLQVEDLYYFMRKVMEKHEWDERLGFSMLEAYERVLPMSAVEKKCLYYLFLYPEKYWKQINFYYNANKAWIPARNAEKIRRLEAQQEKRAAFISGIQFCEQ
ncbi:MAG: spore coat protein CotS [Lachnospiraceae bacterium]|nr:spore coat protein CotS [Lachnospiraceae bacterium]